MNYTKGEWEVYLSNDGETRYITTRDKPGRPNKVIARLISGLKEEEANANLIVAAVNACIKLNPENPMAVAESIPKIYEALKELAQYIQYNMGNAAPIYNKAQQALAKAEVR